MFIMANKKKSVIDEGFKKEIVKEVPKEGYSIVLKMADAIIINKHGVNKVVHLSNKDLVKYDVGKPYCE